MQPTPIEYAVQLIQYGQIDQARQTLASMLQNDPQDASAWALSAWVAPDGERCVYALRQVIALDQGGRLAEWANRKLVLMEHTGALDEEAPPLFGNPAAEDSPGEPVEEPKKEKPRGRGYGLRQAGSVIVILGVVLIALTAAVQAIVSEIADADMSAGSYGFVLIVIGLAVIGVGYILDRSA